MFYGFFLLIENLDVLPKTISKGDVFEIYEVICRDFFGW
jgi:hypothetical protein